VEEMKAAADEAKKAGRYAAIHAEGEEGIQNAIEAGADTIEHCNQLTPASAKLMADRGIFMVPTLAWFFNVAEATPSAAFHEDYIRKGRIMAESSTKGIALAKEAGVRIAAGTDTGAPLVPHSSLRRELEILVRLGLTPMEALVAGTRVAAGEAHGPAGRHARAGEVRRPRRRRRRSDARHPRPLRPAPRREGRGRGPPSGADALRPTC